MNDYDVEDNEPDRWYAVIVAVILVLGTILAGLVDRR